MEEAGSVTDRTWREQESSLQLQGGTDVHLRKQVGGYRNSGLGRMCTANRTPGATCCRTGPIRNPQESSPRACLGLIGSNGDLEVVKGIAMTSRSGTLLCVASAAGGKLGREVAIVTLVSDNVTLT
jgi:hypothetical protein